jgi:hypothetical protein
MRGKGGIEMNIATWFLEGGFMMWIVLIAGLNGVGFAVIHAIVAQKWSLMVSAGLVIATLGAGAAGTGLGRSRVEAAIAMVDPSQRALLEEVGYREASHPVQFGGGLAVLPAILIVVGELRRARTPQS